MADLGGTFDANAKENQKQSSVVPKGDYKMVMVKSDKKPTKNNDGEYLACQFQICDGEYQNRIIFHMYNMWNKSEEAKKIANGEFSELCRAVGILSPTDSSQLHGKAFMGHVVVKDDPTYGMKNILRSCKAVQSQPAPSVAPVTVNQPANASW